MGDFADDGYYADLIKRLGPYDPSTPFEQTTTPGRWKDAQRVIWRIEDMDSAYIRSAMAVCLERGNHTKYLELETELRARGET